MTKSSRMPRLVVAVAAVVLAAVAVPATARTDRAVGLDPDAYAVAEHLGISPAEAGRRMAVQDEAGRLENYAADRWPATFAGMWIDHADGGLIKAAFTRDAGERVAELQQRFSQPGLLRAVTHPTASRDLLAKYRRMVAERDAMRAGRLALPGLPTWRYELQVDVPRNGVDLRVETIPAGLVEAVHARYGTDVHVEAAPLAQLDACSTTVCRSTMRSGLAIWTGSGTCTSGFSVYDWSGNRLTLTAGHCSGGPGTGRSHNGTQFGTVVSEQQSNNVDAEIVTAASNGFYAGGWIKTATEETRQINSWGTHTTLLTGTILCKHGATTGHTCGAVQSKNASHISGTTGTNWVTTKMCTDAGDSGAGVYSGNTAHGIHSASNRTLVGSCTHASFLAYFGHVEFAMSALSVMNIVAGNAEPAPSFTALSGATNLGRKVVATFSKPVRCSSVSTGDFTVTSGGLNNPVTGVACLEDSDTTLEITVTNAFVTGTTVWVTAQPGLPDVAGNQPSSSSSRSQTV